MRGVVAVGLALAVLGAACGRDGGGGGEATDDGPDDAPVAACDWPMWGHSPSRTFTYPADCETALGPDTVGELTEAWFFNTEDVVTATPAVVGDSVYVGDWTGRFYAIDRDDGSLRWTFDAPPHEVVYAGQIVSSAAVADVAGSRTVYFGGGKTLYALDAATGEERWRYELNPDGPDDDPTEIETSPLLATAKDGRLLAIVGWDVHNAPTARAGVAALDAATGEEVWTFDPDAGRAPSGCADVWSSPSADEARGLVFFGTGNCVSAPEGWTRFSDALVAIDLDDGSLVWRYQPHEPNNDDLDFAGSPNVFTAGGRDLVGLGNKDGRYYAVDRETGEPVWEARATEPGLTEPGSNFSTGGFIGPTAVTDGATIVGGTAVGPCPCLHGIAAADGTVEWQQDVAAPTYAATGAVGDVAFTGGTDFTLRAVRADTGDVLWDHEMSGPVSGGVAIQGDDVFAVAGMREPGQDTRAENSGVYRFALPGAGGAATTTAAPTTTVPTATVAAFAPTDQECVGSPCDFSFSLKDVPAGRSPAMTLEVTTDPASVRVVATGLGDPADWLRPGSPADGVGATSYAVFLSQGVDNPNGVLVCVLEPTPGIDADADARSCESGDIADLGTAFDRLSVLAVDEPSSLPPIGEGFDRLVDTIAFDPPLRPEEP